MSTDEPAFKPLDPGRVEPLDNQEMDYWCRELGCTLPQLEAAIAKVGVHVTVLREELERVHGPRSSS